MRNPHFAVQCVYSDQWTQISLFPGKITVASTEPSLTRHKAPSRNCSLNLSQHGLATYQLSRASSGILHSHLPTGNVSVVQVLPSTEKTERKLQLHPTWSPVFKQLHSKPPSPSLSILYRSLQTYFYPAAVTTLIFHPLDSWGINVSNLDVLRHSQRDYVTSGTHFSSQYWQLTQVWVMINNNLAGGLTRYISSPDYKMPNKRSSAYSTWRMGRWKRPDLSCLSYTLCK